MDKTIHIFLWSENKINNKFTINVNNKNINKNYLFLLPLKKSVNIFLHSFSKVSSKIISTL